MIEDFSKSFIETASKLKELASPYVLKIFDYGQFAGKFYVVLEYADGGDLSGIIKKKKLTELEAVNLAIDLVKGLKDLAARGIIHFDIKPENIMLCGKVFKLGDFGVISPRESGTIPIRMEIWGTAAYLPPEYLNDTGYVDSRSDLYSTGITLYQAMTGDNPFQSEKSAVSMFKQINLVPPPLKAYDGKISPYFSELVRGMMEKDPDKRPKLDDVEHVLEHIKEFCELPRTEASATTQLKKELETLVPSSAEGKARELPERAVPARGFKFELLRMGIAKAAGYSILIIAATFAAGYVINNLFFDRLDPVSQPGAMLCIICPKCNVPVAKRTMDIMQEKCDRCGNRMYYCDNCKKCGLEFAHPDIAASSGGAISGLRMPVTCPRCGSKDIIPAMAKSGK